jgi:phosphoglycolate phosphatase-like HAD superfamily hydrolase
MLALQKQYNDQITNHLGSDAEKEKITQELVLCAHAELSSLVNATNYKKHYGGLEKVDKDKILYESVDVIRYAMAIMNTWDITSKEFELAFEVKDEYLKLKSIIDNNPWEGQPVAIIDIDDVLADFRLSFAGWLNKNYDVHPDVESEEYYFISSLAETGLNPESVFENFIGQSGFKWLTPVKGVHNFLAHLKQKGFWIHLLTARPEEDLRCMYDTYFWLKNWNIHFDDISFSSEKFRWCAKSKYYDSSSIKFAIDDSPKHATEYANHGIMCYVPEKSYNKTVWELDNIVSYSSFNKLAEIIDT